MTMTRSETAAWLESRDNFCILTHHNPDGDTVGSAAALCLGLRKMGKTAYVLADPELSGRLEKLLDGLTRDSLRQEDTLVCVDVAAAHRLPKVWLGAADKVALRIDHHGSAEPFTPCELVDPDAAACGEIIYDVLAELGVALDPRIGAALYVAVSTDTGCFRYASTSAHTFTVAAACASAGAALYPINEEYFDTISVAKIRIQSWIVENSKFFRDGSIALCAMPKEVEAQASYDDMSNISGFLRSVEGVKICALLRENQSGGTKLSVRAVPGYDASAVCEPFGGGGHKGASGASFDMPLAEAEKAVEKILLELY